MLICSVTYIFSLVSCVLFSAPSFVCVVFSCQFRVCCFQLPVSCVMCLAPSFVCVVFSCQFRVWCVHLLVLCVLCYRYDLDQLDTADKYPEGFTVTLNTTVTPKDRPPEKRLPWETVDAANNSPHILCSSSDELMSIGREFGTFTLLESYL